MESSIDKTLDFLFGGNNSTLLVANFIFSIILIIIGLVLIKSRKNNQKSTIGSTLVVIGLAVTVFNLVRIVL
ncbi:hypothetical protein [Bacillus gaemokensis]|uniref:Uncharacterized protein n=1 Tax=Bacillus gaemokensis TaxID=574375 RepID=A0A073KEQ8_9BACI|nr:hypothetical protein [Bacillus gaemokensis]KEK25055.1 hypothetical protein BAGA_18365 [Bacillus gaemokensis]KYG32558.1 hypothetical protein AZF08_10640 [Bacillus gaemokensis]